MHTEEYHLRLRLHASIYQSHVQHRHMKHAMIISVSLANLSGVGYYMMLSTLDVNITAEIQGVLSGALNMP